MQNQRKQIRVFNWPNFIGHRTIQDFERTFSAKVTYETYTSNEELHTRLAEGASYDVVVPSSYMVQILIREGRLRPINKSRLANLAHISKQFLGLPFDPKNEFSLPYLWGTTGLGINRERVSEAAPDLSLLFQAEYKDRISMLEGMRFTLGIALKYLGFSINTTRAGDIEKAERLLVSQRPLVKAYTDSYLDLLASGTVWISYCYSGDTYQLSLKHPTIRYQVPSQGTILGIDSLCIPKNAGNPELAHAFINYLLEPGVASAISTELLYATPNEAARRFMDARLLNDAAIFPPEAVLKKSEVLLDVGAATRAYEEAWARIRAHPTH